MKNDEICSQDNQQWRALRKFSSPQKHVQTAEIQEKFEQKKKAHQ